MSIDYKVDLDYKPDSGQGFKLNTTTYRFTPSNYASFQHTQTVTTSESSLSVGTGITSSGVLYIHNLSTTTNNYLQIGRATGSYWGRIPPGYPAGPIWLEPGTTLFVKFNNATGKVAYSIFDR